MEAGNPALCRNTFELSNTALGSQPWRNAWGSYVSQCPQHISQGFFRAIASPCPPLLHAG